VCWIVRAYVGKIERGEVNVSVSTAFKVAWTVGITLSSMSSEPEWGLDDLKDDCLASQIACASPKSFRDYLSSSSKRTRK
jgi:hypothetical protein